jgi:hypothetical protein
MIKEYFMMARAKPALFLVISFLSFYIVIKFMSYIQSFLSNYIKGFWLEPATFLVMFILATWVLPLIAFYIYFRKMGGMPQ